MSTVLRNILRTSSRVRSVSLRQGPQTSRHVAVPRQGLEAPHHVVFSRTYARRSRKKSPAAKKPVKLSAFVSVVNLANVLGVRYSELAKKLANLGFAEEQLSHDYILDHETASLIAQEFGHDVNSESHLDETRDVFPEPEPEDTSRLSARPPVVAIMGHVDHGKTTILDYLRKSSIVAEEHGGITQHIGAFVVTTPVSRKTITFLDTPGHAAFLKMRERGADITDIVVLVVAADDSVMPQTVEAIRHCQKYDTSLIVAVNKCDKPAAKPAKVLADLATHGIYTEQYGGEVQAVEVSGLTGLNMDRLEEEIVALAEVSDLRADYKGHVEGRVIESQVKKGVGNTATVLVTRGTLQRGAILVCGRTWCKVRSLKNERGQMVKSATPATPVEVQGWKSVPEAGDQVLAVDSERKAKDVVEYREAKFEVEEQLRNLDAVNKARQEQSAQFAKQEQLRSLLQFGLSKAELAAKEKELFADTASTTEGPLRVPYVVKADVSGSLEAICESVATLGNEEVQSEIIVREVGPPNDSDIERAAIAGGSVVCFNVPVAKEIALAAERRGVTIHNFSVIYHLIDAVKSELESHLAPLVVKKTVAEFEIKQIFTITHAKSKKKFTVAGCRVLSGSVKRNSKCLVQRKGLVVFKGELETLKQGKDDVEEVRKGSECGVNFKNWDGYQEGDVVEVYEEESMPRYL